MVSLDGFAAPLGFIITLRIGTQNVEGDQTIG